MLISINSRRVAYTVVEDKAIMDYVKKHSKENGQFSIKGNALYRNMERDKVFSIFCLSFVCMNINLWPYRGKDEPKKCQRRPL